MLVVWTPAARTAAGGTAGDPEPGACPPSPTRTWPTRTAWSTRSFGSCTARKSASPRRRRTYPATCRRSGARRDGKIDNVHALRNQYGADVVTHDRQRVRGRRILRHRLSDEHIPARRLRATPSTSSTGRARPDTCPTRTRSVTTRDSHHDPGSAGSTPSYPYAYGYQDPAVCSGRCCRTGAPRVFPTSRARRCSTVVG